VLLVEDDQDDVLLIRSVLRRSSASIALQPVSRLSDALEAVRQSPPDVVLLDLNLPDSTGLATLEAIRRADGNLPVVILTGNGDQSLALRAVRAGAQDYLVKGPLDPELLTRTLLYAIERQQVHRALAEQDALARTVFEQVAESIVLVDMASRRVLDANLAFAQLLGYAAAELCQLTLDDFVVLEPGGIEMELAGPFPAGRPIRAERWYRHREGHLVLVETSVSPLRLGRRQVACVAVRDVTARRAADETRRRLAAAMAAAAEAVLITDADGVIRYVNRAFEDLTGYRAEEVLGQTPRVLKSGQHPPVFYERLWRTLRAGEVWRGQVTNRRADGKLYTARATIAPVRDEEGRITEFVAFQQDITGELDLQTRLARSQTLQALGELSTGIAHDFNNILMAMLSFADLLGGDIPADDPRAVAVTEVRKAAHRGADLVKQLLAFSRQQVGAPMAIDLNMAIHDLGNLLRRTLGEDVVLEVSLASDLHDVLFNPVQLQQVLMNLAVNARDAMPRGGVLRFTTRNDEDEAVLLLITDTGCGIAPDVLGRIFEPYFTTKSTGQGTGLGLATVYNLVEQAGGRVSVDSAVGRGTTFRLRLPAWRDGLDIAPAGAPALGEPAAARSLPVGPPPEGQGETLLLVEDEDGVRLALEAILTRHGYRVLAASHARAALSLAANHVGPIHLLVTDLVLPGMSGSRLAAQLRERRPDLRVLFMTGYADHLAHTATASGTPWLAKPASSEVLLTKLREVLTTETAR